MLNTPASVCMLHTYNIYVHMYVYDIYTHMYINMFKYK